jgi:hypothetical protein
MDSLIDVQKRVFDALEALGTQHAQLTERANDAQLAVEVAPLRRELGELDGKITRLTRVLEALEDLPLDEWELVRAQV